MFCRKGGHVAGKDLPPQLSRNYCTATRNIVVAIVRKAKL